MESHAEGGGKVHEKGSWGSEWEPLVLSVTNQANAAILSPILKMVKNLSAMWETGFDPLEKGIATHSSILAWRIPWQRSLEGYCPWGCKDPDMTKQLTQHHYITCENTPSSLIGPGCNQSGICWDGHLLCIGYNQSDSGKGDKNV